MMNFINKKIEFKKEYFYYLTILLILTALLLIQLKMWVGEYNFSEIDTLKDEIKTLMKENNSLNTQNATLENEKKRLNSGRNAIEGLAREELGLIKEGEILYQFKKKKNLTEETRVETEKSID